MTGYPVSPGELVDEAWLNAIGTRLLWDSVAAGVSLPAASITTPTLSASFKHLLVLWEAQVSESSMQYLGLRINGDSSGHYYGNRLTASGSTVATVYEGASTSAKVGLLGDANNAAYVGSGAIWIPNYASSVAHCFVAESTAVHDASSGNIMLGQFGFGKLDSGVAISTLTFLDQGGGNFVSGARFSVYGVA